MTDPRGLLDPPPELSDLMRAVSEAFQASIRQARPVAEAMAESLLAAGYRQEARVRTQVAADIAEAIEAEDRRLNPDDSVIAGLTRMASRYAYENAAKIARRHSGMTGADT